MMRLPWAFSVVLLLVPIPRASAVTFIEVPNYRSAADSPFDLSGLGTTFFLEDFETGGFSIPGLRPFDEGVNEVFLPIVIGSVSAKSVEPDGYAVTPSYEMWLDTLPRRFRSSLEFVFDESVAENLRGEIGFAITAGPLGGTYTFELFAESGELIGEFERTISSLDTPLFFGAISEIPVRSFEIRSRVVGVSSYFQVDHLQYGTAVPEPVGNVWAIIGLFVGMITNTLKMGGKSVNSRIDR